MFYLDSTSYVHVQNASFWCICIRESRKVFKQYADETWDFLPATNLTGILVAGGKLHLISQLLFKPFGKLLQLHHLGLALQAEPDGLSGQDTESSLQIQVIKCFVHVEELSLHLWGSFNLFGSFASQLLAVSQFHLRNCKGDVWHWHLKELQLNTKRLCEWQTKSW